MKAESLMPSWGMTRRGKALVLAASILLGLTLLVPASTVPNILAMSSFLILFIIASKIVFEAKVRSASSLKAERIIEKPIVEGGNVRVRVVIKNDSLIPLESVEVIDNYPSVFKLVKGSNSVVGFIPAKGALELEYSVKPVLGKHRFPPTRIVVRDPAGVFAKEAILDNETIVRVQPRIELIESRRLLSSLLYAPGGMVLTGRKGMGIQFIESREYVSGDDYRFIEWKSTARTGKLMVKVFEQESSLNVVLILDNRPSMAYGVLGKTKFEYMVRWAASIAKYLLERGDNVGIAYSSSGELFLVKPGRGRGYYSVLARSLADIEWPVNDKGYYSLDEVVTHTFSNLSRRGKYVYIVFSDLELEKDEDLESYIDLLLKLKELRNDVIVISPYTPFFEVIGLKGLQASIYRLYSIQGLRKREEVARELMKKGVTVVNVGPEDLVSKTLARIEAIRLGGRGR